MSDQNGQAPQGSPNPFQLLLREARGIGVHLMPHLTTGVGRLAGVRAANQNSTGTAALIFSMIMFVGSVLCMPFDLRHGITAGIALWVLATQWVNIPSGTPGTEPSVGLLRVLGTRMPIVAEEGWHFVLLRAIINYQIISIQKANISCSTIVSCERNPADDVNEVDAQVRVDLEATFEPNTFAHNAGQMLVNYGNAGGRDGAEQILIGPLLSFVKDIAITYQWETFSALRSALNAALMMRLSDRMLKRLPRTQRPDGTRGISDETLKLYLFGSEDEHGNPIDPTDEYDRLENVRVDVLDYVNEPGISNDEKSDRLTDVRVYLENALRNGGGDMDDIGIRVTRLNVLDISPTGALGEMVDLVARTKMRRRAQVELRAAVIETALEYVEASKKANPDNPMAFEAAMRAARVDLGEAEEIQTTGSGRVIAVTR